MVATKKKQEKKNPSIGLYRRIALSFAIFTFILLFIVSYLAFSSATITIYPSEEVVSTSFITSVRTQDINTSDTALDGVIFDEKFKLSKDFQATGKKELKTDIAGFVTLYNTYNKDQPLVATTRLLTPDGQLFRLKNKVVVPAGGEVSQVEIYADDPKNVKLPIATMTHFTLPGLWEGLQDKIYAQNSQELSGATQEIAVVIEDDISGAQTKLEDEVLTQAKQEFISRLTNEGKNFSVELTQVQLLSTKSNAFVGDEKETFTVDVEAQVIGVAFSKDTLKDVAILRLRSELPDDKELGMMDVSVFTFQLANYDSQSVSAEIQVYLEGQMFLKHTSSLLEKNNFVGKTKKEVIATLTESPTVKDVTVDLRPFWLSRVPRLPDHVNIIIKRTQE